MVSFFIRVVINGLAIAITAWLLPGITIVNNNIIAYLVLGLFFGLINAFIRPVVMVLSSRLILWTLGWFILVINALMIWLVSWILPGQLVVQNLVFAVIGGVIMAILSLGLEAVLGLARPIRTEFKREKPSWYGLAHLPFGLGTQMVENLRTQEIYDTFWRYGSDMALDNTAIGKVRNGMQRFLYRLPEKDVHLSMPAKVRVMLQELGPTYVKMGQIVSSQTQFLPDEWLDELAKLQNNVPPFPADEAHQIIEDELGQSPDSLFTEFEREPFAAASTAQVHKATLASGEHVVIKVQRPNIGPQVQADLGLTNNIAAIAERRFEWARNLNLAGTISEFGDHVMDELDYKNEALNGRRLSHNLAGYPDVHVPTVYPKLTSSKVLTMEFVKGVKITNTAALDEAGLDRHALAESLIRSMVKQIMFDGFFHADPHPGNIMVNLETGTIIFLDAGMMGHLTSAHRTNLLDLLFTLQSNDTRELGRVLIGLSTRFKPFDEEDFYVSLDQVMSRYLEFAEAEDTSSDSISAALSVMQEHGLRLNEKLTMALKALFQAEEAARTLDPAVLVAEMALEQSKDLFFEQLDYDTIVGAVKKEATRSVKEVVRRIPSLTDATVRWLDQYESGRLTLHVNTDELAKQAGAVSTAIRFLTMGIIVFGMLVGSAYASTMSRSSIFPFLPDLAQLFFLIALLTSGALVARMVWRLWHE